MQSILITILQTIVGVVIIMAVITIMAHLINLPFRMMRELRLRKLAKNFMLSYHFGEPYLLRDFLNFFQIKTYKRNIISGRLDNREIELYDLMLIPIVMAGGPMGRQDTILKINGKLVRPHATGAFRANIVTVNYLRNQLKNLDKAEYYTTD